MDSRPNLLFIMSDDHAAHAISAYGSDLNSTPNLDRIASEGARLDNAFCTNSICAPSRAAILTGTWNHVNGVTTLDTPLDNSLWTFPKALQGSGWQTGLFGKWHLGHDPGSEPTGFDTWRVLPGQGHYHNPVMVDPGGVIVERGGYVTDLITDDCLDWIAQRDVNRPFAAFCHHKAPHRTWEPDAAHFAMYDDTVFPQPHTFRDDLRGRSAAVQAVRMHMMDLDPVTDLGAVVPAGLSTEEEVDWRYQRYLRRYLGVVASIDDNVGRMLDFLDTNGLTENTVVIYTSDQGFFLGDHGWFDKRLMYEESLRMPLLIRHPATIPAGTIVDDIVVNVDFGPTILDVCGADTPAHVQGRSFEQALRGGTDSGARTAMYYRYWMHGDGSHNCPAHYGVRTDQWKLICYYNDPLGQPGAHGPARDIEWELYDLVADPYEVDNVINAPAGIAVRDSLFAELVQLQSALGDEPHPDVDSSSPFVNP